MLLKLKLLDSGGTGMQIKGALCPNKGSCSVSIFLADEIRPVKPLNKKFPDLDIVETGLNVIHEMPNFQWFLFGGIHGELFFQPLSPWQTRNNASSQKVCPARENPFQHN